MLYRTFSLRLYKMMPLLCRQNHLDAFKAEPLWKIINKKARKDIVMSLEALKNEIHELEKLRKESEQEFLAAIDEELRDFEGKFKELQQQALESIVDDHEANIHNCLIEIGGAVGGQESMLFASELCRVYMSYARYQGWSAQLVEEDSTGIGGMREAVLEVKGQSSYKWLRHEGGVHRVQRVPTTEKSGRIHTSTVTVAVLPFLESQSDVQLKSKDLLVETKRSSGPGGQNVNKTESCVRIVHIPTGIAVESQETRHQIENRAIAMERLKNILMIREVRAKQKQTEAIRKSQVTSADYSDKVRTYNYPQDRITDHRLNFTTHDLKTFMSGDSQKLHTIICMLQDRYKSQMLEQLMKTQ